MLSLMWFLLHGNCHLFRHQGGLFAAGDLETITALGLAPGPRSQSLATGKVGHF
jgi:hypothetical protein